MSPTKNLKHSKHILNTIILILLGIHTIITPFYMFTLGFTIKDFAHDSTELYFKSSIFCIISIVYLLFRKMSKPQIESLIFLSIINIFPGLVFTIIFILNSNDFKFSGRLLLILQLSLYFLTTIKCRKKTKKYKIPRKKFLKV